MLNLNILKNKKPVRIFAMFLGVLAASITCVNPASANEIVSLNSTTPYVDLQVYSSGGSYVIRGFGDDPVIQLYRGASIAGFDNEDATPSGDFLADDDDGGGELSDRVDELDAYLSGSFSPGLGNYVIRVTSFDYWRKSRSGTPTESYTLTYTGFSRGTAADTTTRQTHNRSFANSFYGSDKLSDPTGELKNTVDSINAKWGYLLK